jgi:hypothetical protein
MLDSVHKQGIQIPRDISADSICELQELAEVKIDDLSSCRLGMTKSGGFATRAVGLGPTASIRRMTKARLTTMHLETYLATFSERRE